MKLLFISYGSVFNPFLPGGGALRIHKFASFLKKKGWKVSVVSGNFPGSENIKTDYDMFFLGNGKNAYTSLLSFSLLLPSFIRKKSKDFDIIIEDYSPFFASFSPYFHKNSALQLQIYIGKENFRRFPFPFSLFFSVNERFYPKLFKNAIFVCEFLAKSFGFDSSDKRYKVVWNGIDSDNLRYEPKEDNFILYCGRISYYMKGLDILLSAIGKIKNFLEKKGVSVVILGDGPDRPKLESLCYRQNLPVKFLGWISDRNKISEFYSKCLFSVLPSRYEGFGLSILESASFAKTSVISDIPAFSWARHFCLVFRKGDPDDLAEKIVYLLEKKDERRFLGELGREFAKDKTWENMGEEFEKAVLEFMRD